MKKTTIIAALILVSFLCASCQSERLETERAKETEKKEVQVQETRKSEVARSGEEGKQSDEVQPQKEPQETPKPPMAGEKQVEGLYEEMVTFSGEMEKLKKYLKEGRKPRDTEGGYIMHVCDRFTNLSILQDPAAINITEDMIKTSQYAGIRACATEAMGWYGNKKAVQVLLEALKDKDNNVKLNAAGALLQLNEEVDAAVETIDALAQEKDASSRVLQKLYKWEKVFDKGSNNYVRTWRTLWNSKCEDIYRKALTYPSDEIKADAAWYFARKGDKELKDFIESLAIDILKRNKWERRPNPSYKADDWRTAEYAIQVLEEIRSKKALPILKDVMHNPNASYVANYAKKAIAIIEKER